MTTRKNRASTSLAAGMALVLTISTSGTAAAKDVTVVGEALPQDALSEAVSYADLDLTSKSDVKLLSMRVRSSVSRVCSPFDQRHTFLEHGVCRSFAWNGAKPQMERAIARAQQLASIGTSAIAPVAIVITAPVR